ncbi:BA75_02491T0 [Komagataella pastoris]|uniref:BA75_02491T0 n=1 Tax=Komagataella pastoris TaxID=4922 RepID=A0A1B2JAM2_PICPA|nr:BA75_02491T0 [Komagataella pastoris]
MQPPKYPLKSADPSFFMSSHTDSTLPSNYLSEATVDGDQDDESLSVEMMHQLRRILISDGVKTNRKRIMEENKDDKSVPTVDNVDMVCTPVGHIPSSSTEPLSSLSLERELKIIESDNTQDNCTNPLVLQKSPPNKRRLTESIYASTNESVVGDNTHNHPHNIIATSFHSANTTDTDSTEIASISVDPLASSATTASLSSTNAVGQATYLEMDLPLPSPSASPSQTSFNNEEEELISSSFLTKEILFRLPTSKRKLTNLTYELVKLLSQDQSIEKDLIWRLLSKLDRANLSSLNHIMNKSLKRDLLNNLPLEISTRILSFLSYRDLLNASFVCRNWSQLINNRSSITWKRLLIKDRFFKDEDELNAELIKEMKNLNLDLTPPELVSARESIIVTLYRNIYRKSLALNQRWFNPEFQPRRISVSAHGPYIITCLQFDEDKIITSAEDKTINIYDTPTGKLRSTLKGHEGGVWAMKYYGNTLVTGSTDRTVRIWDIKRGACTHILRGHTSTVRCLEILEPTKVGINDKGEPIVFPTEPLIVTGSRDHTLRVWKLPQSSFSLEETEDFSIDADDYETFDTDDSDSNPFLVAVLRGHIASVRSVTGQGNIVISGSYDNTARVWDLRTGECTKILKGHTGRVYSVVLDSKRNRCISGSVDFSIKIWDLETGDCLKTMNEHTALVGLLGLSDNALVSAAADTTLRIWDPETGEARGQLEGHIGAITCFQHNDRMILSGAERMLKVWNTESGNFVRELLTDVTGGVWQVRFNRRRCVAAVQRKDMETDTKESFIEILDFGENL